MVGDGHRPLGRLAGMTAFSWKDRSVLVTGATGMVGSWLVKDLLAREARVVTLVLDADPQSELLRSGDLARTTVVNGALEDFRALERALHVHEVEVVFHLGAQTLVGAARRAPLGTFEANIRGTYQLLEACRLSSLVRAVVLASSDKAYGEVGRLPYTEAMPVAGRHPYDVSKSCADLLGQAYHHTYDLPVAIARCGNIYGGGDLNWSRIVPGTIRGLLRRQRPVLRSDGSYVRDYLYVKDATAAYLQLAERMDDAGVRGEAFNFGTEAPLTVLEVVVALQKRMDCTDIVPDIQATTRGEIRQQWLSAAKARQVLQWRPAFELERGLAETIEWYRGFLGDGQG